MANPAQLGRDETGYSPDEMVQYAMGVLLNSGSREIELLWLEWMADHRAELTLDEDVLDDLEYWGERILAAVRRLNRSR